MAEVTLKEHTLTRQLLHLGADDSWTGSAITVPGRVFSQDSPQGSWEQTFCVTSVSLPWGDVTLTSIFGALLPELFYRCDIRDRIKIGSTRCRPFIP